MPTAIISQWGKRLPFSRKGLTKNANTLLRLCNSVKDELSIVLVTDATIAHYNETYRGITGPTNVLSFPMGEKLVPGKAAKLLGDVIISVDTASREARELQVSVQERVIILVIHGLLHLLGYDHERSAAEAAVMEKKEQELLSKLCPTVLPCVHHDHPDFT